MSTTTLTHKLEARIRQELPSLTAEQTDLSTAKVSRIMHSKLRKRA